MSGVAVRPAAPADVALIAELVRELARYERLEAEATATPDDFAAALFGETPRAGCDIAELAAEPVGFALWFRTFSTFTGRGGLYLEDLYVRPAARGAGAGKALLARLARRCADEGLARLEWSVLDWNAPAIGFYDALGAQALSDWVRRRLSGPALAALAAAAPLAA